MKILTKGLLGVGAAAAALVSTAAPAEAQYRYRDRDGISAGEVIAGAVILGSIAAILSSSNSARYPDNYDRRGDNGYRYDNSNSANRAAINQCVNQVENRAGRSNVTQIRNIDRTRYGYRIQGTLREQNGWRGNDRYDRGDHYDRYDQGGRYDQGDRNDRTGYGNEYDRGYEAGQFTCYVERGRVVDIDYNGPDR